MLNARIEAMAAADGLSPYIVSDNRVANTTWAHESTGTWRPLKPTSVGPEISA
jgi:hypothetical protein